MSEGLVLLTVAAGGGVASVLTKPGHEPAGGSRMACSSEAEFKSFLHGFLDTAGNPPLIAAAFAAEGQADSDRIVLAKGDWALDVRTLRDLVDTPRVHLLNSAVASAMAAPRLLEASLMTICDGHRSLDGTMAVIGPGLGAGVSFMAPDHTGNWLAVPSYGGGLGFAPRADDEVAVFERMGHKRRLSLNEVLSIQGFESAYRAWADLLQRPEAPRTALEILALADQDDRVACETVRTYSAWLGGFSKTTALMSAATGGVYLCGWFLSQLINRLDVAAFTARFHSIYADEMTAFRPPVYFVRGSMAMLGLSTLFHHADARHGSAGSFLLEC